MLQAIALAQIKLANLDPHSESEKLDEDVWAEVTEHYKPDPWPHVEVWDWCGEWEPRR
jgi:hypothetical protein